ncbi:alpha/beta-Hydrolases superfamily protein, partial [Striga asiatica]
VRHGVAMHPEGYCFFTLLASIGLIPCTSIFWCCAIFVLLVHHIYYICRRAIIGFAGWNSKHIGWIRSKTSSAISRKFESIEDIRYMDTTHPSPGRVIEMLSQDTVMDRALEIYEQVQAGHEIPSFIEQRKIRVFTVREPAPPPDQPLRRPFRRPTPAATPQAAATPLPQLLLTGEPMPSATNNSRSRRPSAVAASNPPASYPRVRIPSNPAIVSSNRAALR